MKKPNTAIYVRGLAGGPSPAEHPDSQRRRLREYARQHGYRVAPEGEFQDQGCSGASLARPGLAALRRLVRQGQVQRVLAEGPDRLSRHPAELEVLLQEFAGAGVQTEFGPNPTLAPRLPRATEERQLRRDHPGGQQP